MTIADAYDAHDALGLAQLVHKKEVTPGELLEEAIRRVCAVNPQLNAVVLEMFDEGHRVISAGLPDGPLRGVPFLLKDLAQPYAGFPLTHSSKLYEKFVPRQHGELTSRYLRAGVVIFGRTSSSEFGILPTTEPLLHGPCHNPWKQGFTTGGSSGGAAAVVAARIVPVAHGGDAGGSIRIPASCCGVFGLKPSRGRNPVGPDTERGHGLATEHVLSLTVRDSAAFLDATAGPGHTALYRAPPKTGSYLEATRTPPGKLKIAFTHRPLLPGTEDPDCRRAVEDAVRLLSELGHECVEAAPPVEGMPVSQAFFAVYCAAIAGELQFARHYLGRPARPSDVEPITWLMGMIGRSVLSAGDFSESMRRLQEMSSDVHGFMESYDCYLTPTLGRPPVAHGSLGARGPEKAAHELVARLDFTLALKFPGMVEKAVARAFGFAPFTPVSNVTGQPSMSVPLWWNAQGLPVGVCFTSRLGDEATLFRLAAQLEQARPWRAKRPPTCAA